MLIQPLAVRMLGRDRHLHFLVGNDAALPRIDEQHPSRTEPVLVQNLLLRNLERALLRSEDDEAVLRHAVASRTEAVPVEDRADLHAVRERHRGGTVPRLHQRAVIFVKRLLLRAHALVLRPRLRHHHHRRVRQRTAGEIEQLQHIVEHRRVRSVRIDDRLDLLDVVAEQLGLEQRLARVHPVDVAAQRVDLAVVDEIAVRMRAVPARERVRAETGMDERDRRFHRLILQIGIERFELRRRQHPFVDDLAARQAGDVELAAARKIAVADRPLRPLPDDVQLPFEGDAGLRARAPADEHLADVRLRFLRGAPEPFVVGRHRAPADHVLAFLAHDRLKRPLLFRALPLVVGHEQHADGVIAFLRQRDAQRRHLLAEEAVRNLDQDPGAVARVRLAALTAAVLHVLEDSKRPADDGIRFDARNVRHEAHAACIPLKLRVIQPLLRRNSRAPRVHVKRHLTSSMVQTAIRLKQCFKSDRK